MAGRFNPADYIDVQERITRFWGEYPEGRIITELMSLPDEFERVVFRASVFKQKAQECGPDATGWAAEVAGGSGANQTSWHENGETSSIGRALANMGYATKGADRPSRQEMEKANRGQESSRPQPPDTTPAPTSGPVTQPQGQTGGITPEQIRHSTSMAEELGVVLDDRVAADFNKGSLSMLTQSEGAKLVQDLRKEVTEHRAATKQQQKELVAAGSAGADQYTR